MRIDRKARPWIIGFSVFLLAAIVGFYFYCRIYSRPSRTGGTWPGLAYGLAGYIAMGVAMLLALRKANRRRLVGKVSTWMQAHVWFGLISYPLILFHAGNLTWGGALTVVVMWLFTVVFISGIVGLAIQNVVPTKLAREVPAETITAQIDHVQAALRDEAQTIFRIAKASAGSAVAVDEDEEEDDGGVKVLTVPDSFINFYEQKIVPFLADKYNRKSPLASPTLAQGEFFRLRERLDKSLHPALERLESLVDERRQLVQQRRLHSWLYWWLVFHIPLSYGLIVLATIHAIMAWPYMTTK
jgi:hypothetical protein